MSNQLTAGNIARDILYAQTSLLKAEELIKAYAEQEVKKHLEIAAQKAKVEVRRERLGDPETAYTIVNPQSITAIKIDLT